MEIQLPYDHNHDGPAMFHNIEKYAKITFKDSELKIMDGVDYPK